MNRSVYFLVFCMIGCDSVRTVVPDPSIELQIERVADGTQKGILLYECKNTDAILKTISQRAPLVESICLSFTDVTFDGLSTISKLEKLQVLDLDSQLGLEQNGIEEIAKSRSISRVLYWGSDDLIRTRLSELGLLADECRSASKK